MSSAAAKVSLLSAEEGEAGPTDGAVAPPRAAASVLTARL